VTFSLQQTSGLVSTVSGSLRELADIHLPTVVSLGTPIFYMQIILPADYVALGLQPGPPGGACYS